MGVILLRKLYSQISYSLITRITTYNMVSCPIMDKQELTLPADNTLPMIVTT